MYAGRTLGRLELLRLACTPYTACESSERNNLFVVLDIAQVGVGFC